jgi:rod shape-determining protein MreB
MANTWTGRDLAVDLGSATTRVYARGRGLVVEDATVVARDEATASPIAVGAEARGLIGRAPAGIEVVCPVRHGVIADVEAAEQVLRHALAEVTRRRYLGRPRLLVTVPTGISSLELRAVKEVAYRAGARRVWVIEQPLAAALGAGLPIHLPTGNLIVDVGAATTEVAVIASGAIVTAECSRTAGEAIDRSLAAWAKREHGLVLGAATAEDLARAIGSAFPGLGEGSADVRGRDISTGLPRTVTVAASDVRAAIDEQLNAIVETVRAVLDRTPPELAGDLMDRGMVLTGGGALLRGLDLRLEHETGMPVHVPERPGCTAVLGAGRCVEDLDALQHVFLGDRRRAA